MDAHRHQLLAHYPTLAVSTAAGVLCLREAGHGRPVVLLHGIGSGSASWVQQLDALSAHARVLAWDAPGYGLSTPLSTPNPCAADYALALQQGLRALGVADGFRLVGHSLGALIAAAYVAHCSPTPSACWLVSPAQGYGQASVAQRTSRLRDRLAQLTALGVEGLAEARASHLCAPGAPEDAVQWVRWNMARLNPSGYAQAAWMLAHDDLLTHARHATVPLHVWCGEHDTITPADASARLAQALRAPFVRLPGVGHACYIEGADAFNQRLAQAIHHQETAHG